MVRNVGRETEIILVCDGIVAYFGLEHSSGTVVSFAFAITKLHTCWCLCMPSFGELLHFNVELPSMHHSNFNYIIQMTLQIGAHVKKQQQQQRLSAIILKYLLIHCRLIRLKLSVLLT